ATYGNRGITFGSNEEGEIFDVRSYSKELQEITISSIEKVFGSPGRETESNNDIIYTYEINSTIQLKFIISIKSKVVDHISVFNQQRTIPEKK
ncbi:MAG: YjgB family protein, partial [Bacillus sp. (in: Bacteria)]|nr:YjgB family protein [Bacillus sp. (in: firmicutes)]